MNGFVGRKPYQEISRPSTDSDQAAYEEEQIRNRPDILIIREMIYDEQIPRSLTKNLWGLISKSQVLSNIDDKDERIMLRMFAIVKRDVLCSMCTYDITPELRNNLANLECVFRANLTRAKGPNRERMIQSKQIYENIHGGTVGKGPEHKTGLLSSIGGKLFGKKKHIPAINEMAEAV